MSVQVKPNHFLTDTKGNLQAVVLSLIDYERLMRLVEDAEDSTALKRAVRTSRGVISHAELVKRLKRRKLS